MDNLFLQYEKLKELCTVLMLWVNVNEILHNDIVYRDKESVFVFQSKNELLIYIKFTERSSEISKIL